jgi:hypothetical protein
MEKCQILNFPPVQTQTITNRLNLQHALFTRFELGLSQNWQKSKVLSANRIFELNIETLVNGTFFTESRATFQTK